MTHHRRWLTRSQAIFRNEFYTLGSADWVEVPDDVPGVMIPCTGYNMLPAEKEKS